MSGNARVGPSAPELEAVAGVAAAVTTNVARVVVGKESVVELLLVALLCGGHVVLEDVPGVGKTLLARALARSLACRFSRIQFTPDLLPSDITGINYYNQKTGEFEFRPGPVLAQVVLADEINRATPRTQASLLECMQEGQVTVDGRTHSLARPFLVLATQNPVELEGTFPLPEAQLDRFFLCLAPGYPSEEEEKSICRRFAAEDPLEGLEPVVGPEELTRLQQVPGKVHVNPDLEDYIVRLARRTREHPAVSLGVSPRGTLSLYRACQARAALKGRGFVVPDDVKALAGPVLAHRLAVDPGARLRGRTAGELLDELVAAAEVPVEDLEAAARSLAADGP